MRKICISFKRIYAYLKPCQLKWGIGNLCDIVGLSIFSILTATALEDFINAVAELQITLLYDGLKKLAFAVLVMFIFEGLYKRLFFDAMSWVKTSMQNALFCKLIEIPCILDKDETVAEKMTRLNQDVDISINFVGENLTSFFSSLTMAFVSVFCIGFKSWILGTICMISMLAIIIINFIYQPK